MATIDDSIDREPLDGLSALLGDARVALERRIAGAQAAPDVADVWRRAGQLDPDRFGLDETEEPDADALPFVPRAGSELAGDAALDEFLSSARPALDRDIDAALSLAPRPPRRRRAVWPWAIGAVGLAAAAAALLTIGFPQVGSPGIDNRSGPLLMPSTAEPPSEPALSTAPPSRRSVTLPPPPTPADPASIIPEPPAAEPLDRPTPKRERKPARRPARQDDKPAAVTLADRDREAQRLWRAGEIARAEAIFRDIIAADRSGSYAQTAYGELFAIARAAGNDAKRIRLWRAYLGRFPRGRYADDVRAAICRRVAPDEAPKCWASYRRDFPRGAHRSEAARTRSSEPAR